MTTPEKPTMNIYGKLAKARIEFHAKSLTKSGHNKFAGYNYFELGDFIPHALKCLADNGLCTVVSYTKEVAMMRVFESDGTASIELTSPMSSVALKGCHDVQNLGAVQTYLRRYLWVSLMEIIETDGLDGDTDIHEPPKKTTRKVAEPVVNPNNGKSPRELLLAKCAEYKIGETTLNKYLAERKAEGKEGAVLMNFDKALPNLQNIENNPF